MSECMEREIREMLPDVLHGAIVPGERARIDSHLAVCGDCRRELEVLRAVHGAAVFAPAIDVDRIVRQIPPYRIITPPATRPTVSRAVGWLVAAGLVFVVAGGGSVLMSRTDVAEAPSSVASAPATPSAPATVSSPATHSLALASGVEDLSDGGLVQLISELSEFDAIPAADPEPVFDVDATATMDQDSL